MRYVAMLVLLVGALGCGVSEEPTTPAVPERSEVPTGPGVTTAPDGVPIAYTVSGNGLLALVFIHGWMCDQGFWAAQVPALASDYTVVTLDLAGHGASGKNRENWTLVAFGEDVKAVAEQLGLERVILIGHSMGGPVALEAAKLMSDRVLGVIGVDTLQNVDWEWNPEEMDPFIAALEKDFPATCGDFVTSMFLEDADPELVERVRTDMCSGQPEVGVALMKQFADYDESAALAAVTVPVRCINSTKWPTNIENNRSHHQNFDALIVDGVDHFLMMERPANFNALLKLTIAEITQGGEVR